MNIDSVQSANKNQNFGKLKKIKFVNRLMEDLDPNYRQGLLNAVKQSRGLKDFFDKYDGTLAFYNDKYDGLGSYAEVRMKILYKLKDKFFQFRPKKFECYSTAIYLEDARKKLCETIREKALEYFEQPAEKSDKEKCKDIMSTMKEQIRNNKFFES